MMMLRNSEQQCWKRCRHQWDWTYNRGRTAREAGRALRFGDLVHQALAAYRPPGTKFGPHPALTFETLYHDQARQLDDEGFNVYSDDQWISAYDLGKGMLNHYVERFQERDAEFKVISTEQTFQLIVVAPLPPHLRAEDLPPGFLINRRSARPRIRFKVVGTFDGVWQHRKTKRISFKEYKTAATIQLDGLSLDEQAGQYWTYGPRWLRDQGILKSDQEIKDILYTFLRKAIPDPDAVRDSEGRILNKPKKEALLEAYAGIDLLPPERADGKKGLPLVDDLIRGLALDGRIDPIQLGEVASSQPSDYFTRLPVYRDQGDRERIHERITQVACDIVLARTGKLPLYKNPGPLHLPNCRFCAVKEACEVHECQGDWEPVLDAITAPWAPYEAHNLPERH